MYYLFSCYRPLGIEVGSYKASIGSLHIYERDLAGAKIFLSEGWQSTKSMDPMPRGDPWPAIAILSKAEDQIRTSGKFDLSLLSEVDTYWRDLIWMLQAFYYSAKQPEPAEISTIAKSLTSPIYGPFIEKLESRAQKPKRSLK